MREAWAGNGRGADRQWARHARRMGSASAMRYTVGNGKNGKTHGTSGRLLRHFLPLVMPKTPLPTVHPTAYRAISYRW